MACFGFGSSVKEDKDLSFTNFVLRVDVTNGGWEKTVAKILKKTKDVSNFKMYGHGHVQVSGMVDPVLLLKQLGKSVNAPKIVYWKFGRCPRNLHMPEFQQHLAYQDYYDYALGGGGYGHHGGGGYYPHGRSYSNAQYYPYQTRSTHSHRLY